jgi:hypothetical protein
MTSLVIQNATPLAVFPSGLLTRRYILQVKELAINGAWTAVRSWNMRFRRAKKKFSFGRNGSGHPD